MVTARRHRPGFTLIELLVVIAIVAVLAVAVILSLNPAELLRQARDANRAADINALNKSMSLYLTEQGSAGIGTAQVLYASLPDSSSSCASQGLPGTAAGWSYGCVGTSSLRAINGNGWVPVALSGLASLPVDPVNRGSLFYMYTASGTQYVFATQFESSKYRQVALGDGGGDPDRFEAGSNKALLSGYQGVAAYWPFDEGSGSVAGDASGNGNAGSLQGGVSWLASGCVRGGCIDLNGSTGRVYVPLAGTIDATGRTARSVAAWVRLDTNDQEDIWLVHGSTLDAQGSLRIGSGYPEFLITTSNGFVSVGGYGAGQVPTGAWTHVAAVYSGSQATVYINGVQAGQTNVSGPIVSSAVSPYVGGPYWNLDGRMDEIRIYNRALSAGEVLAQYQAGL